MENYVEKLEFQNPNPEESLTEFETKSNEQIKETEEYYILAEKISDYTGNYPELTKSFLEDFKKILENYGITKEILKN